MEEGRNWKGDGNGQIRGPALPAAVMQLAGAAGSSFENQVMQFGGLGTKHIGFGRVGLSKAAGKHLEG